ncbi:MAG TPA: hypothetical protein VG713_06050 [Pirellulales bacterium]|nr:hypothetical protein [Pirellulales bacterium]
MAKCSTRTIALIITAATIFVGAGEAKAQFLGYNPWWYSYVPERLPYFAQFPPVYYSYAVPRPYGFSPYAYPFSPPNPVHDPVHVSSTVVAGPYSTPSGTNAAPAPRDASPPIRPVMIKNPFVK